MRGLDGLPQPPHELVARLKQHDERIGLFYTNAAWAITEAWGPDDPRRQWIKEGAVQPEMAFDICGYLPVTCSLDEAPAYIARELKSYTPEQFRAVREAVLHWNLGEGEGLDAELEDKVLGHIDDALSKDGPSIGVFNVPVQVVDNAKDGAEVDPAIAAAMAPRRRKKA